MNDLLLAAYYRAVVRQSKLALTEPISIMSMLDLRQYMIAGQSEGICNLSKPFPTCLPYGVGETFSYTLSEVTAQTTALKSRGMASKTSIGTRRFLLKSVLSLPFGLLCFAGKKGSANMPIGITNLGNISSRELTFGDAAPEFAYFAGQIKKKPGIQLAVMSVDGTLTMTIANVCGEADSVFLEELLELIDDEVRHFGSEENRTPDGEFSLNI